VNSVNGSGSDEGKTVTRDSSAAEKRARVRELLLGGVDPGAATGGDTDTSAPAAPGNGRGAGLPDEPHTDEDADNAGVADPGEAGTAGEDSGVPDVDTDPDAVTLKALAERLDVKPADLYELEIPMGDRGAVTLGELKDAFKQYGPVKEAETKLNEQREEFERAQMVTRAELNALMQVIPAPMREGFIREAQARNSAWQREQETAIVEAIPDWKDTAKRAADRAEIVRAGAEYGFSEAEITYTSDARTLRMLRDFAKLRAENAAAKSIDAKRKNGAADVSSRNRKNQGGRRALAEALRRAKIPGATQQTKVAAVSALLNQRT